MVSTSAWIPMSLNRLSLYTATTSLTDEADSIRVDQGEGRAGTGATREDAAEGQRINNLHIETTQSSQHKRNPSVAEDILVEDAGTGAEKDVHRSAINTVIDLRNKPTSRWSP
jgi:hypothetical protein